MMKKEIKSWINAAMAHKTVRVRDIAKLLGELNFLRF
jgi:hypothetical protein